jgi:hypothetical protein
MRDYLGSVFLAAAWLMCRCFILLSIPPKMKVSKLPLLKVVFQLLFVASASSVAAQTTTVLYNGWDSNFVSGNSTVFAPGVARPGTAGVDPYCRYLDADASVAGEQVFATTGGIANVNNYTGPVFSGGVAWCDMVRPDDTSTRAGTVFSIRNDVLYNDAGGTAATVDTLRSYILADGTGISPDEAFGALLFDYSGGAGLIGLDWVGTINTTDVSGTLRWVVVDGGTVYVSEDSVTLNYGGWRVLQRPSLADVTATNWAVWNPVDILDLKFSNTSPSYAAHSFSDVTQVGVLWEIADAVDASNYIDTVTISATRAAVAPVITSSATASGNVNIPFSYQIEASDNPTTYGVTGTLPDGLNLDSNTGEISGTPTTEEVQTVTVSATNAQGTGTASLEITIGPELLLPEVTSPSTADASAGGDFIYTTTADNDPTGFSATGLPTGLEIDPVSGVISGVAMEAGTFDVTITASNALGSRDFDLTLTINSVKRPELPGGRKYRCYFLGNSLTLSLTTAPQPELARLERLFAAHGNRLEFGATLGAGVNLDQHWNGQLYSGTYMKQTYFDDGHEYSLDNGWAGPGADFGTTVFRDYNFALQGKRRNYDGTIVEGEVFDALVIQPYVCFIEPESYPDGYNPVMPLGDRLAINNFIDYASGNNPAGHESVRHYYIYSVWPQLIGIENAAIDTDGNGVYSFSEFYDQPYEPPINPPIYEQPREHVPCRDYLTTLQDLVCGDNPGLAERIHVIPVGEVFAELDRLIRTDALTGFEAHHSRMEAYYLNARLNEQPTLADAGFVYIYPPNEPENFQNGFIREQGIKNIYADGIHWNNQTHNDPDSGTIGAYVAAATIHTVITGENPNRVSTDEVAGYYEAFDPDEDAALIEQLQQVIWQVVTSTNWNGVNYAERTGVGAKPDAARSYRDFAAAHFSPAELANPLVSGEEVDADMDGDSNIEEYFRLGDPTVPDAEALLTIMPGEGTTGCSFTGLSRPVGLSPALELSGDLNSWDRLDDGALQRVPLGTTGKDAYTVTVDTPGDKQFFRVNLPYVADRPTLPLVAWGPSAAMVSGIENAANGLNDAALDLSTPANPVVGASYDTYSPIFYAASSATGASNSNDLFRINDNSNPEDGTGDVMLLKWTSGDGLDNSGVFTAVWTQDGDGSSGGFLNGADTGDVHLAGMEVRAKVGFGQGSVSQMRFVIRKDGQFYISGDRGDVSSVKLVGANEAPYERVELPNLHGTDWFEYDPETDTLAIGQPVAIESFDGITAVGFNWRTSGDESLRYFYVEGFRADFYP